MIEGTPEKTLMQRRGRAKRRDEELNGWRWKIGWCSESRMEEILFEIEEASTQLKPIVFLSFLSLRSCWIAGLGVTSRCTVVGSGLSQDARKS